MRELRLLARLNTRPPALRASVSLGDRVTSFQQGLAYDLVSGGRLAGIWIYGHAIARVQLRFGLEQRRRPYERQSHALDTLFCLVRDPDAHGTALSGDPGHTVKHSSELQFAAAANDRETLGRRCLDRSWGIREDD